MSLIRLLPARFHALADYAVAALLILVPLFVIKGSMLAVGAGGGLGTRGRSWHADAVRGIASGCHGLPQA
jgi:hypothetical protein